VHCYWNTLVYKVNYNIFFDIFSRFLATLSDRCTIFEHVKNFRPPWPPHLVKLVRTVNQFKRRFRKTRFLEDYKPLKFCEKIYKQEKLAFEQDKRDKKIQHMNEGQNIWSHVRHVFKPYSPTFRGLTKPNGAVKDKQEIADQLAEFYEKHFVEPAFDSKNSFHLQCLEAYERIKIAPRFPLDHIKIEEVILQWKNFDAKNLLDSVDKLRVFAQTTSLT
jgi:hypothetical protein